MIDGRMRVIYLVANNAYAILFGDSLLDIDGKRFFQSMRELKEWLSPKGLTVKGKSVVTMASNM